MIKHQIKLIDAQEINEYLSLEIYSKLFDLNKEYPNFDKWFFNKTVKNKNRKIILYLVNNDISGISILKNEVNEKKICTLRVFSKYQNLGIGSVLIEKSFEELNTETPIISVSESKLNMFTKLFKKYNFKLANVHENYYINKKNEFVFNGVLDTNSSNFSTARLKASISSNSLDSVALREHFHF